MKNRAEAPQPTPVYGIIGWPVHHSRSPAMHNRALAHLGLPGTYVPFAVPPQQLGDAVRGLSALGIHGVNVTVPHKRAVLAHLDQVEDGARAIGAVNTIARRDDALIGLNTDAPGLARALAEGGVALQGADAVVLGAGGAARASVVGLAHAGARRIAVAARRPERAKQLCDELQDVCHPAGLRSDAMNGPLESWFRTATLVVQATSATLGNGADAQAFADALPWAALPETASVVDLVYDPLETSVLRAARAHGLKPIDGLGMLVHQGAIAFEHWTGHPAPLEVMREALR